ncbi:patatin-like phospholipase family protein [Chloroflexota bacterium]
MTPRKIGLALGGGAARGLAHVGVLAVLEREGIPIDRIAGTSAGAAVGALYAQHRDAGRVKELALSLSWKKLAPLVDPSLPKSGFIKGKKIKDLMTSYIGGDIKFKDLKIPFACVATDIDTGEEVVIDRGSVPEAVRASISIPVIFTAVKWGNRYLVDGDLVNPVPVNVVKQMGADFIIAVNVIPDVADRTHHRVSRKGAKGLKEPNIFHIIMQSIYVGTYLVVMHSLEGANIVIEPWVAHIGQGDFNRARECISLGELAAQNSIPEIKRKLENL